jgi:tryptophan synthase alpha chain
VIAFTRMQNTLTLLRDTQRKALVPFITVGDPSMDACVPVMHALVAAGADMLELGVPFSDPMADGVVIQRSSERALERGVNAHIVFNSVTTFRETNTETPVILMGYLNPIERRGWDWYAENCQRAGVDALLIVDLPPEEASSAQAILNAHGVQLIQLLAPTTSAVRLHQACQSAQGYLYYVSMNGVTGKGLQQSNSLQARVEEIRQLSKIPVFIGFGIKDAETAQNCARMSDGVIIGSALVERLSHCDTVQSASDTACQFLAPIRQALDALK